MEVVDIASPWYDLDPEGLVPSDGGAYKEAVSNRVNHLIEDFNFIFEVENQDHIFHPAIWEAVINVLWFPTGNGDVIGEIFAVEFENEGVPLWLIANIGGFVC